MTGLFQRVLLVLLMIVASTTWAVDENRIWLPKKYQQVKPKLLAAAREAESTKRCQRVVAGEMITRKNTAEYYYFVITCRDDNHKTYNITYHYPVAGRTPVVVAEQRPADKASKAEVIDIEDTEINADQAAVLCNNAFLDESSDMEDVILLKEQQPAVIADEKGFFLALPYTTESESGKRIRYRADCRVADKGNTQIDIFLEEPGALVICSDHLRSESILLGRVTVLEEEIQTISTEQGFIFQIPFNTKTLKSSAVRYQATCQIDPAGNSEVKMVLQAEGAFALCKEALVLETFLMKDVSIAEQARTQKAIGQRFEFEIAFDANDPEGNLRKFQAYCQVDEEGEASVEIGLDKSAIISVCINGVISETQTMLGVTILEQEIPALQRDKKGFFGLIPFDAKDPSGRPLYYQGECRVDDVGRTKVKIRVRRN